MSLSASTSSASLHRSDPPDTRLWGRWLMLARGVWFLLAAGPLANFIASIPTYYARQHIICTVGCLQADQPTPGKLLALYLCYGAVQACDSIPQLSCNVKPCCCLGVAKGEEQCGSG